MNERIKKEFNEIHAPEELVKKTAVLMKQEEAKKASNKSFLSKRFLIPGTIILTAALIFFFVRFAFSSPGDAIHVAEVSNSSFSLDLNLGSVGKSQENKEAIQHHTSEKASIIPDFLAETEPSQINKVEVHIGFDEKKDVYYASYQQDEIYHYVVGEKTSESDFIDYLKKEIK